MADSPTRLADFAGRRTVVVFGPNGAGKTSLLRALAGIDDRHLDPGVAYLPQFPYMFRGSVAHNLALGLEPGRHAVADRIAAELGLSVDRQRSARTLSGGEAQRVALARVLADDAPYVLLDEPLAPIDVRDRQQVARVIAARIGARGAVIVTHDITTLATLADEMVVVIDGAIRQRGPIDTVFVSPADDDVATAVGIGNALDGIASERDESLVAVDLGPIAVWALGEVDIGARARVMFGAETVTVFTDVGGASSARNHYAGTVRSVVAVGRLVEVIIDVGVEIAALLTPGSADALEVAPGRAVAVSIKATAVRAVPHR